MEGRNGSKTEATAGRVQMQSGLGSGESTEKVLQLGSEYALQPTPIREGKGHLLSAGVRAFGNGQSQGAIAWYEQRGRRKLELAGAQWAPEKKWPATVEAKRSWVEPGPESSRLRPQGAWLGLNRAQGAPAYA